MNKEIIPFIKKIKEKGFKVKVDTNGSFPDVLQSLIEENLVDYVAMDIKNTFEKYQLTTNCNVDLDKIKKSINILLTSFIDYEFRTTVVKQFHTLDDLKQISENIKGAKNYYLQSYLDKDSVLQKGLSPLSKDELQLCLKVVKQNIKNASLRGVD